MDDILKTVSSPLFVVGTLISGLLVNLVSNYLQRSLDRFGAKLIAWRGAKSAARQAQFDADLDELLSKPNLVELYIAREARIWSASLLFFLLSLTLGGLYALTAPSQSFLALNFGRGAIVGCAVGTLIFGMTLMDAAMQTGDVLRALYKARRDASSEQQLTVTELPPDHDLKT